MNRHPPARPERPESALDRPAARLVALGVVALVIATLGYIHWEDVFPSEDAKAAADDPAAPCITQRTADIEAMRAEGTLSAEQASLFKTRAEALCRAQAGQTGAPPPISQQ
ncbi:MAG: hypothetical protein OEU09_12380 [Rhodospirillales bacterium]|nr:hypothetical protein [Rhodospirillales bacterium]MDH3912083.1 hypothetical protein [Rhodospirillales bacterium]MDH3919204.1 hypothetical protein [Rhodospirillales bacterium]MDH3968905.1 hypothetical protein [Rhodospirillales bacterium]